VRQAVAHAINRQDIIDGAMFGYGTPIGTHFAPHNPDYVDLTDLSAYNPDRARALAGRGRAAEGFTTAPDAAAALLRASRRRDHRRAAARRSGSRPRSNLGMGTVAGKVFRGHDFDLTIVSHTEPMDIGIYANPDYYFQYDNPDFQALMTTLTSTTDPEARSALLAEAQSMIAEDYVNAFLFELAVPTIARAGIEGLWLNQPTAAIDLTAVTWP
jgi:peptide/nickel transport system substrate-binding protein